MCIDAVMRLVEGGCDLLIAYHHSSQPFPAGCQPLYEMVSLGRKCCRLQQARRRWRALFRLPGRAWQPLPYLGYAPGPTWGG